MKKINWLKLVIIVFVTEFVGFFASLLSGNIKSVYMSLNKPTVSPPSWFFGIVWIVLYFLIAIAVYVIYESERTVERKRGIILYWLQLFVNFLWPIVFFRFLMFKEAFLTIIVLDILVIIVTKIFYKINRYTIALMTPYVLWSFFATYLNLWIILNN